MKHSRPIEVIKPTLRRSTRRAAMPLTTMLTIGAALLTIVLSVSLSSAANTPVCSMPLSKVETPDCH